ncbi:SDR family NAD(P)-dependent oxidoreductase [Gemmatimonadota bacterium]
MKAISGKLALITGASAGIGEACARRFAAEGANLALWARRVDRLEGLAQELESTYGVETHIAGVDIRDRGAVRSEADSMLETQLCPDIVVNNAGLAAGMEPFQDSDPEDWDLMIDTNVKGLLYVSRFFLPSMIERGVGHIIMVGSIAGHLAYPSGHVYNATKFAVRALTEAINVDVVETPIRISSVDPGWVRTEFATVRYKGDEEKAEAVYDGYEPLHAEDVAEAVLWVSAQPLHVNVTDLVMLPTGRRNAYVMDGKG